MLIADVYIFRSTLSLRRATRSRGSPRILVRDFYPRSPCGERLRARAAEGGTPEFSIHALLAESDRANNFCLFQLILFYPRSPCGERLDDLCIKGACCHFLSTLSLRRATQFQHLWVPLVGFSIHALLAESDGAIGRWGTGARDFSIHALLAESDRSARMSGTPRLVFLSTLSLRRATGGVETQCRYDFFLSTLSLRRATPGNCQNSFDAAIFYPRSPCGERRKAKLNGCEIMPFSIHALLAESDDFPIVPRLAS